LQDNRNLPHNPQSPAHRHPHSNAPSKRHSFLSLIVQSLSLILSFFTPRLLLFNILLSHTSNKAFTCFFATVSCFSPPGKKNSIFIRNIWFTDKNTVSSSSINYCCKISEAPPLLPVHLRLRSENSLRLPDRPLT